MIGPPSPGIGQRGLGLQVEMLLAAGAEGSLDHVLGRRKCPGTSPRAIRRGRPRNGPAAIASSIDRTAGRGFQLEPDGRLRLREGPRELSPASATIGWPM